MDNQGFAGDLSHLISRAETAGAGSDGRDGRLWAQVRELLAHAASLVALIGRAGR